MKSKSDLSSYLAKRWFYYVLWLLICVLAFVWAFHALTAAKDTERVNIFICCRSIDKGGLKERLLKEKPDGLKEINVYAYSADESNFGVMYMTQGLGDSDILILPDGAVDEETIKKYFAAIPENLLNEYFSDAKRFVLDGRVYGVRVCAKDKSAVSANGFVSYFSSEDDAQDHYLYFNVSSKHIDESKGDFGAALVIASAYYRS